MTKDIDDAVIVEAPVFIPEPPTLAAADIEFPGLTLGPEKRLGVRLPHSNLWLVDPYIGDYDRAQTAYHAAYQWALGLPEAEVLKLRPSQFNNIGDVSNLAEEVATMHAINARDNTLLPRILVDTIGRRLLPDQFTERQLRKVIPSEAMEYLHPWIWQLLSDASDPLD